MADKNHENTKTATAGVGAFSRRAMVESYNEEEQTFTVSFASEMPVLMQSFWSDDYYEVLKMDGQRTARLDAGVPLLDNHDRGGSVAKNVIGVSERHWVEGDKAYASVKLSERPELEGLRSDVKNGIIRNISCGYRVFAYTEKTPRRRRNNSHIYRYGLGRLFEISLVPVPADRHGGSKV
jgi:phage head maturation protease